MHSKSPHKLAQKTEIISERKTLFQSKHYMSSRKQPVLYRVEILIKKITIVSSDLPMMPIVLSYIIILQNFSSSPLRVPLLRT